MKRNSLLLPLLALLGSVARAEPIIKIETHDTDVDGARLHYLEAGTGDTLLLIHGYSETSHMWRPILPIPMSSTTWANRCCGSELDSITCVSLFDGSGPQRPGLRGQSRRDLRDRNS